MTYPGQQIGMTNVTDQQGLLPVRNVTFVVAGCYPRNALCFACTRLLYEKLLPGMSDCHSVNIL
jgi:hypothetical protein